MSPLAKRGPGQERGSRKDPRLGWEGQARLDKASLV